MKFLKYSKVLQKIFMFAVRKNRAVGRTVKANIDKYKGAQIPGARSPWQLNFVL